MVTFLDPRQGDYAVRTDKSDTIYGAAFKIKSKYQLTCSIPTIASSMAKENGLPPDRLTLPSDAILHINSILDNIKQYSPKDTPWTMPIKALPSGCNSPYNLELFPKDMKNLQEIFQGQIGDCFLLSSIKALAQTDNGAATLKQSIQPQPDGSYNVKFPGAVETINVTSKELQDLGRLDEKGKYLGVNILEIAYGKLKAQREHIQHINLPSQRFPEALDALNEGGDSQEALEVLTGHESTGMDAEDVLPSSFELALKKILPTSSFNNSETRSRVAMTGATEGQYPIENLSLKSLDPKYPVVANHVYTIKDIDALNQQITVLNPWDTTKPISLSFDDFKKYFPYVATIKP